MTEFTARKATLVVDQYPTPQAFRDHFKRVYGPTIAAYRNIADDPERVAALDRDLVDLARGAGLGDNGGAWSGSTCWSRRSAPRTVSCLGRDR